MIVWEFAWADSALVVLDEWSIYRGCRMNRFDCNMIEESKYCSDVMKKHFNKELAMTKEDNKNFNNSNKCWICENDHVENDAKVRDHCHII